MKERDARNFECRTEYHINHNFVQVENGRKSILGVQEFHIQKLHDLFLGNGSVGINIHRHTDHIHPMPLWEQNPTNSLGCSFRHEKWPWSSTTHDECRLLLRFYQQKSYSWWCFNTATSDDFYQRYGLHKKNAYKHLDTTSVTQECVISVCVCVSNPVPKGIFILFCRLTFKQEVLHA